MTSSTLLNTYRNSDQNSTCTSAPMQTANGARTEAYYGTVSQSNQHRRGKSRILWRRRYHRCEKSKGRVAWREFPVGNQRSHRGDRIKKTGQRNDRRFQLQTRYRITCRTRCSNGRCRLRQSRIVRHPDCGAGRRLAIKGCPVGKGV